MMAETFPTAGGGRTIRILTLGDGDFTYSLDLARYACTSSTLAPSVELTATGIDSREDLVTKYRDAPYVLDQLQAQSSSSFSCSIQHSINAIVSDGEKSTGPTDLPRHMDHVIFHHPHLGTEDAVLHGEFLCHFFHSCVKLWMRPKGGLLYLTLVEGQYERWKCAEAGERQGLALLQRFPFMPPPVDMPHYHYRRHQTGKSFESRRPNGSETFVFGRKVDYGAYESTIMFCWNTAEIPTSQSFEKTDTKDAMRLPSMLLLSCPHCDKTFKEARSRKCHLRDKHPDGADKRLKRASDSDDVPMVYKCVHCVNETGDPRILVSEQALEDHMQAKHSALHRNILPDWYRGLEQPQKEQLQVMEQSCDAVVVGTREPNKAFFGTCSICGIRYRDQKHACHHLNDFVPFVPSENFNCTFCDKVFRERRAKLQHENFCPKRQMTIRKTT